VKNIGKPHARLDEGGQAETPALYSTLSTLPGLGRLLGNRSLGSLILNGRRQLSKAHIEKLSEHFGLSPAVFRVHL